MAENRYWTSVCLEGSRMSAGEAATLALDRLADT